LQASNLYKLHGSMARSGQKSGRSGVKAVFLSANFILWREKELDQYFFGADLRFYRFVRAINYRISSFLSWKIQDYISKSTGRSESQCCCSCWTANCSGSRRALRRSPHCSNCHRVGRQTLTRSNPPALRKQSG